MADTLVERLTGQAHAADVNAEVQIVIGLDAPLDDNNQASAELDGYRPLPVDLARDILATSKGKLWWRRLYAAPVGGPLARWPSASPPLRWLSQKVDHVAGPAMPGPYCDAPIRHIDHIQRYTDGG